MSCSTDGRCIDTITLWPSHLPSAEMHLDVYHKPSVDVSPPFNSPFSNKNPYVTSHLTSAENPVYVYHEASADSSPCSSLIEISHYLLPICRSSCQRLSWAICRNHITVYHEASADALLLLFTSYLQKSTLMSITSYLQMHLPFCNTIISGCSIQNPFSSINQYAVGHLTSAENLVYVYHKWSADVSSICKKRISLFTSHLQIFTTMSITSYLQMVSPSAEKRIPAIHLPSADIHYNV